MTFDPAAELEKPFGDYSGLIAAYGQQRPDRVALDDGIESLTWSEVAALVERIAAQLQRDGLQKGQAVAILAPARCAMRWPISGPFAPVAVPHR